MNASALLMINPINCNADSSTKFNDIGSTSITEFVNSALKNIYSFKVQTQNFEFYNNIGQLISDFSELRQNLSVLVFSLYFDFFFSVCFILSIDKLFLKKIISFEYS